MDRWDLGQADPLQWICREWVQELGFDETTVNVKGGDDRVGTKNTKVDRFAIWGEWAPYSMVQTPIWSDSLYAWRRNLCPSPPPSLPREPSFYLWEISYLIYLPSVYPDPTLVSHPCLHLSARPIIHSFWHSMSCCDPDSTAKESRPHKWGQDVSCVYLMRRWRPFIGLLLHHALMGGSQHWDSPLGRSRRLPSMAWYFPFSWSRFAEDKVVLGSVSWRSELFFSSSVIPFSSAWAMGLIWNGPGSPIPLAPQ